MHYKAFKRLLKPYNISITEADYEHIAGRMNPPVLRGPSPLCFALLCLTVSLSFASDADASFCAVVDVTQWPSLATTVSHGGRLRFLSLLLSSPHLQASTSQRLIRPYAPRRCSRPVAEMLPDLPEDRIQQLSLDKESYFREMVVSELEPVKGSESSCRLPAPWAAAL